MLVGIVILLACQAVGEWLAARLGLPLPGPVLGMTLLAVALAVARRVPAGVTLVADVLLRAMPLFFIPAGVGVLVLSDTLRAAWLPITVALVVSTLLAIASTALVMKVALRLLSSRARAEKKVG